MIRRPAALDSLASLAASAAGFLLSIPASILIARALGPTGKGVVTLTQTIVAQGIIFSLGVEVALIHAAGRSKSDLRQLAGASLGIASVLGPLGATAGVALLVFGFDDVSDGTVRFWMLMSMTAIPLLLLGGYLQSLLIATGRLVETAGLSALRSFLTLMAAVVAFAANWGVSGFLALNLAGVAVVAALTVGVSFHAGVLPPAGSRGKPIKKHLVTYGLKSHLGTVLHGLNNRLDVFVIGALLAPSALGLYSVAVTAAETLLLVPTFVGTLILQRAAADSPQQATRFTSLATRMTSAVLMVAAVVLALLARPLIRTMFGPQFIPAVTPLLLLLPGVWALGLWRNLTNDLMGRGFPVYRTTSAGSAAVVTLALDLVLVPRLGIEGAAVASSVAYATAFLVALIPYLHITGESWFKVVLPQRSDLKATNEALRASLRYVRASRRPAVDSDTFYEPSE